MGLLDTLFGGSKFNCAMNVLMADYTFDRLSEPQKEAVQKRAQQLIRSAGSDAIALYAMPHEMKMGFFLIAMREQGIKPAIAGEEWRSFGNPFSLKAADEEAQAKAHKFIKEKYGIDVYGD